MIIIYCKHAKGSCKFHRVLRKFFLIDQTRQEAIDPERIQRILPSSVDFKERTDNERVGLCKLANVFMRDARADEDGQVHR